MSLRNNVMIIKLVELFAFLHITYGTAFVNIYLNRIDKETIKINHTH